MSTKKMVGTQIIFARRLLGPSKKGDGAMKTIAYGAIALLMTGTAAVAQYGAPNPGALYGTGSNPNSHYVSPYVTNRGTYVPGHVQTNPNNTQLDNYGTRGNLNPYTGQIGTRVPRY